MWSPGVWGSLDWMLFRPIGVWFLRLFGLEQDWHRVWEIFFFYWSRVSGSGQYRSTQHSSRFSTPPVPYRLPTGIYPLNHSPALFLFLLAGAGGEFGAGENPLSLMRAGAKESREWALNDLSSFAPAINCPVHGFLAPHWTSARRAGKWESHSLTQSNPFFQNHCHFSPYLAVCWHCRWLQWAQNVLCGPSCIRTLQPTIPIMILSRPLLWLLFTSTVSRKQWYDQQNAGSRKSVLALDFHKITC